jgi:Flp pilus assembly pilin Flp
MKRPTYALGKLLVRAIREDDGGEVMEYAMTLGFLAIACYVLVTMVGMKFVDVWQRVDRVLGELG